MKKNRSHGRLIQSEIHLKPWIAQPPTVAEARPAACPGCKAASCPLGGRIQIHGHGLRERQVRGPLGLGEKAVAVVVSGRRYRCGVCGAVFLVVPREVLPRRQYSAAAIGFALALWGLVGLTAIAVRLQISPSTVLGFAAMTGWVTLRRWAKAVKKGCLLLGARCGAFRDAPRRGGARGDGARGERGSHDTAPAARAARLPRRRARGVRASARIRRKTSAHRT